MRILIYGAGVIGSFYASRFAKAGLDVTVLARGQRLKELQGHGLWYRGKTRTHKVEVKTISELKPNDRYQFIFLTVRENQVEEALEDISRNESPNVVTMVEYDQTIWQVGENLRKRKDPSGISGSGRLYRRWDSGCTASAKSNPADNIWGDWRKKDQQERSFGVHI